MNKLQEQKLKKIIKEELKKILNERTVPIDTNLKKNIAYEIDQLTKSLSGTDVNVVNFDDALANLTRFRMAMNKHNK